MNNLEKLNNIINENKELLHKEVEAEITHVTLQNELVRLFPMRHGNIDKMHIIWSRVLRDIFWLGWITSAKGANGRYPKEFCNEVEQSLKNAFHLGREYVKIKK